MKKTLILVLVLIAALCVFAACESGSNGNGNEEPQATAEPTKVPVVTAEPTATPEPTEVPTPSPEPEPGTYDIFALYGIGDPITCDGDGLLRGDWKSNLGETLCWGGPIDAGYGGIDPGTDPAERCVVEVELDDGTKAYAIRTCADGEGNYTALWNCIYNFPGLKTSTKYKMTVTAKFTGSPAGIANGAELRECWIWCSGDAKTKNENKVPIIIDGQWHTYEYTFTTKDALDMSSDGETTLVDFNVGPDSESGFMYVGFEMLILNATLYEVVE